MAKVLIVDDDRLLCETMADMVERMGHDAASAFNLADGIEKALSGSFDVVFLDVRMPDGSGLDGLPQILDAPSSPEVIIITAHSDPDGAELAIKTGAWDYLKKSCSKKDVTLSLTRALQYREQKKKAAVASAGVVALKREGIVGDSAQIRRCLDFVAQAAVIGANVLITGETGTGKEVFASTIHQNSPRADRQFIVLDCAALPETLVESMLFGHQRGAFTGADQSQEGLIQQADGGTLFLDEVAELPLSVQKKFLRVLQEKSFRPLGGKKEVSSDFRLIAATNRNLDEMVSRGEFRKDLLFRLRTFVIDLPPLRERKEDIKALAGYHLARRCERHGLEAKALSSELIAILMAYDWPGNIRELVSTLEVTIAAALNEHMLFLKHLPTRLRIEVARASAGEGPFSETGEEALKNQSASPSSDLSHYTARPAGVLPTLQEALDAVDKQYMVDLMALTQGNIEEACRISGLSRSRLYVRLNKYNLLARSTKNGESERTVNR